MKMKNMGVDDLDIKIFVLYLHTESKASLERSENK